MARARSASFFTTATRTQFLQYRLQFRSFVATADSADEIAWTELRQPLAKKRTGFGASAHVAGRPAGSKCNEPCTLTEFVVVATCRGALWSRN